MCSLLAAHADGELLQGSASLLAYVLQLVNRGKIPPAFLASLHLKGASPYFPLAVFCLHDDMLRRADINARTASDTCFGILDEWGTDFLVFASAGQADGTNTDDVFTGLNAKSA